MKRKVLVRLLLAGSAIAILATLNLAPLLSPPAKVEYSEGDVVDKDFYAPISFPLPKDSLRLETEQDSAAALVLPVLYRDTELENRLRDVLENLHIPDSVPADFSASTREILLNPERGVKGRLLSITDTLLASVTSQGYFLEKDDLTSGKVIIVMQGGEIEESVINLLGPRDLDTLVENAAFRYFPANRKARTALYEIIFSTVGPNPNLVFDRVETEARREAARLRISPYEGFVERGELITEAGGKVDQQVLKKINALNVETEGNWRLRLQLLIQQNLLYMVILSFLIISVLITGMIYRIREILYYTLLFIVGILASFALRRFSVWWFVPTGFIALSVAIFLSPSEGVIMGAVSSLLMYLPWHQEPEYLLYALLTSFGAMLALPLMRRRAGFIAALGFVLGSGIIARGIFLLTRINLSLRELPDLAMSLGINSVLNIGFLLLAFIIAERIFGFTSALTLAELADLNRPLFKRFALKAAGTYHHSVLVGNLAETAARSIGVNRDLALAGGYYHDIGKMIKPEYFIENQLEMENPHDTLKPRISSLVLASHVKEGMIMAEKMHLPRPIRDIINQHHGTTRMEFFYQKHLKDKNRDVVPEEDFRYPGPKPQTKEAALVMLADSVEASVRSRGFDDREDLEKLIKEVIEHKISDGQLDECAFTTADIHDVRKAFTSLLVGMFHPRIRYEQSETRSNEKTGKPKSTARSRKKGSKG